MNQTPVTLYAGDTYSLTTGRVTRSAPTTTNTPTVNYTRELNKISHPRMRILEDSKERVQRNDMNALAYVMRNGGV